MLADVILIVHVAIAGAMVAGFVLVPLGARLGWHWVRRRRLRLAHLAAMAFIAFEALAGIACPLTVWEDRLRGRPADGPGFIEHWIGALLYWDLPGWVFVALYTLLAMYAFVLWRKVPPWSR